MPARSNYLSLYHATPHSDTVIGVWDLEHSPFKLGNVMLFDQSLLLLKTFLGASKVTLYLCADKTLPFKNTRLRPEEVSERVAQIQALFTCFSTVEEYRIFETKEALFAALEKETCPLFPFQSRFEGFDFKSYLLNDDFRQLRGKIPYHSFDPKLTQWAKEICSHSFSKKKLITLHLRYDASFKPERNADLQAWISVFETAKTRFPTHHFLLIGNDVYPAETQPIMAAFSNVSFSKSLGFTLLQELALISVSGAFLGIASGPSNAAILSDMPYLIYKHEADAWAEKFEEVPDGNAFPFAGRNQYFRIQRESRADILNFLEDLNHD